MKHPAHELCSYCYQPDRSKDGVLVTDEMYVVLNNQNSQNKGKRLEPEKKIH
jgi:heterodisulfide reductase subunit B